MKAIVFTRYGLKDGVQFTEVAKPTPNDDQVLIKVHAAAANPLDWHRAAGEPILARMGGGFRTPKNQKLGADFAGVVEAVGKNILEFKPGDEVIGSVGAGAFAEYVCTREPYLVKKPAHISFEAAASAPVVGLTALQGLRKGQLKAGQKVLVNGAAGGIGTYAVQIAKSYGAEVTGVCSTRNLDMVRSIGADHVVDYTREDFTRNGERYDLIYDAIANRSIFAYRRALTPHGICVIAGITTLARLFEHALVGRLISREDGRKVGLMGMANVNKPDLVTLVEYLETGKIVPVIDRSYPLTETAEALRYLYAGHARGKVIISVIPASAG